MQGRGRIMDSLIGHFPGALLGGALALIVAGGLAALLRFARATCGAATGSFAGLSGGPPSLRRACLCW